MIQKVLRDTGFEPELNLKDDCSPQQYRLQNVKNKYQEFKKSIPRETQKKSAM